MLLPHTNVADERAANDTIGNAQYVDTFISTSQSFTVERIVAHV